jgi:hypothetical protein
MQKYGSARDLGRIDPICPDEIFHVQAPPVGIAVKVEHRLWFVMK